MVRHVLSFGRNGVHDFLLVRMTAIIMLLYILYIIGFILFWSEVNYQIWKDFFSGTFTRTFTMLVLMSVLIHGWIGMWQVLTDYVKPTIIRGLLQFGSIVLLLGYFFSGLFILWGG